MEGQVKEAHKGITYCYFARHALQQTKDSVTAFSEFREEIVQIIPALYLIGGICMNYVSEIVILVTD